MSGYSITATGDDFHTGPEDCQKCGAEKPFPAATFAKLDASGGLLQAVLCMDCLLAEHGLKWRKVTPSTIIVPGGRKEQVH